MGMEYVNSERIQQFIVYNIGYEACDPRHSWSYALPDRYLLHYVFSGKGILRVNGKEYSVDAGSAFLIGNKFSYYEADGKTPWKYAWLNMAGSPVKDFLEKSGLTEEEPIYRTKSPELVEKYFLELLKLKNKDDFMVYSEVFGLLSVMLKTGEKYGMNHDRETVNYVESACDFIAANYHKKISADDICAYVGLEYSYLFRLFKKECGISPSAYLTDYRMKKAAELCRSGMSVKEIAPSVGYEDRSTFSKAFSRHFNMPVSEYKSKSK